MAMRLLLQDLQDFRYACRTCLRITTPFTRARSGFDKNCVKLLSKTMI